jgi:predicted O-methyltransferase YrrM
MGSGFGYSAYWFARAISIGGRVVLTDLSTENIEYAKLSFHEAGLGHRAEFRVGDALKIGREYDEIDILFLDLDKHLYLKALEIMLPALAKNALVIADNALWYGSVLEQDDDLETQGIKAFNEYMFTRSDFFTTIVPVRDGVMIAYRLD